MKVYVAGPYAGGGGFERTFPPTKKVRSRSIKVSTGSCLLPTIRIIYFVQVSIQYSVHVGKLQSVLDVNFCINFI